MRALDSSDVFQENSDDSTPKILFQTKRRTFTPNGRERQTELKVTSSNGAGIWSERPPVLDSSGVMDVEEPEEPNVEYTEVLHLQMADPVR
ncbi:platelet endothelial cell adhesion molecule isoform X1, partial [Tachysurus ichikawai]